tara:strand:- start:4926 stop:7679 length:2754 start_codon:yes stop_codon:yes gene_type:complete
MTIENVGLGKLPNVYFQKINLEDGDTKSFSVLIDLIVLDEAREASFIWSEDPLFRGFMRIAVIETSNTSMISELTLGSSPHPTRIIRSNNWDENTKIHKFGFSDLKKSEDEDDKHFKLRTVLTKPLGVRELTLFAYAYIDHQELSKHLGIKLTGLLSQYMGPVLSETVISNEMTKKTSNAFMRPNGEMWSGPVHEISKVWYSGSKAAADSLKLVRQVVKNSKLTDARTRTLKGRFKTTMPHLPIFSEAHYALTDNANLFGIFSMNMKQFVLSKTKFGKSIYGLGDDLFSQVLDSILVNSVEIRRRQIKYRRQTNKLGTPMFAKEDVAPYTIVTTLVDLLDISLINDKSIRTFQFSDLGKNEGDRGEFVYEVHMSIVDKTQQLVEDIIDRIKSNLNGLKDAVRRLNSFNNYNDSLDELRVGEAIPAVIEGYIDDYYIYFSMLNEIDQEDLAEMKEAKKTLFSTSNYRKKYGTRFISEYQKIQDVLQRKFGVFPRDLRQHKSKPFRNFPPNIIELTKVFEETVTFADIEASYDVLGISANTEMATLTKEEFINRADLEVSRFFDTSKAVSNEDLFQIDSVDASALKDLGGSKMLFMSPLGFKFKGVRRSIEKISDVDLDGVTDKFIMSIVKKEEKSMTSKSTPKPKSNTNKVKRQTSSHKKKSSRQRKSKFKFNFRPVVLKINNVSKKREDHRESVEYLGPNSEFVNIEANLDRAIEPKDAQQIARRISVANKLSTKRTKKKFDLTEKGNFYEKLKSSKNYNPEKLRKMPLSTKSLFNSRSSAARNNILEAETDLLKSVDTKVCSEMIFHANQKIEAFIGFEKTISGEYILSKPIWSEVTPTLLEEQANILCRMVYAEDASIGLEPALEFKLKVQNSTFVIKGDGGGDQRVIIPDVEQELPEIEKVVFITSNITKQPRL